MNPKEALTRAQSICSRQEQCRQDMVTKLQKWGINDTDVLKIINKLEKDGFINEMRYALSFARDKMKFNKWGRIKIVWMLRQRNIPDEITDRAMEQINGDEYENLLVTELKKKMKTLKSDDHYNKKRKLIQFALQRGFENEIVYKVVNNLVQSRSEK